MAQNSRPNFEVASVAHVKTAMALGLLVLAALASEHYTSPLNWRRGFFLKIVADGLRLSDWKCC